MSTQHKHASLIKAWADGAKVQFKDVINNRWVDTINPEWNKSNQYRIKPKETVVRWLWIIIEEGIDHPFISERFLTEDEVKARYAMYNKPGYKTATYKKAEWTRTEFDK